MEMSPDAIRALLDAFERSDWREMVVEVGEDRLHVSRDQLTELAPPAVAPAPRVQAPPAAGPVADDAPRSSQAAGGEASSAPPAGGGAQGGGAPAADDTFAKGTRVESPSVGLFWR